MVRLFPEADATSLVINRNSRGRYARRSAHGRRVSSAGDNKENDLLLCCVCAEQSSFRYEVIYHEAKGVTATLGDVKPVIASRHKPREEEGDGYYNFPARHPRWGYLRWPVAVNDGKAGVAYFPDYPVHLRTTTIRRGVVVGSLTRRKKKSKRLSGKPSGKPSAAQREEEELELRSRGRRRGLHKVSGQGR